MAATRLIALHVSKGRSAAQCLSDRTDYPRKENLRDILCQDIDAVLSRKPKNFDEFLQHMQIEGYEVKQGKNVSLRGKSQKRFIRLSSLGEGYSEAEIYAVIAGEARHQKREKASFRSQRTLNLVIDIQAKLREKGAGYRRWATVYNLKQMSKTLLLLRDKGVDSLDQLDALAAEKVSRRDALHDSIQASEKRLAEIATLKKHIINYSKTRATYESYRKAGYSKKFLEEHREEITIHKAAKSAFDELGVKTFPRIKDLSVEYAQVLSDKKQAYAEYRQIRDEAQELLIAQRNIAALYSAGEQSEDAKRKTAQEH